MADNKQLNTVIVLRHDTKESWEADGAYVLRDGEVGVGYVDIKNAAGEVIKTVVMAKIGNGQQPWTELPQLEGVFEEDVILTYNFGRHKTTNGSVNTGGAGMTTSEWLIDALSEILYPTTNYPGATFEANGVTTDTGDKEIGSKITALKWNGGTSNGTYKDNAKGSTTYGTFENKTSSSTGIAASNFTWSVSNSLDSQTSTSEDGSFTLTSDKQKTIESESSTTYGYLDATVTLDASKSYTPLDNVGNKYTAGRVNGFNKAGDTTKTFEDVAVNSTGFRKPFWGIKTASAALDLSNITSADVRALPNKGTSTKGLPTTTKASPMVVAAGSQQVLFFAKAGQYTKLTATDDAAMGAGVTFTKVANAVIVAGANNYGWDADKEEYTVAKGACSYDMFYVDWGAGIDSAKKLILTWS